MITPSSVGAYVTKMTFRLELCKYAKAFFRKRATHLHATEAIVGPLSVWRRAKLPLATHAPVP